MAVKNKLSRAVTVGVLLLAALGIIYALINFTGSETKGVSVGQAAPDFTLTDLNGKAVSLSDLKGKVVLLNFWGTWCEPCRKEMPALQAAYEKYKDKGLVILGVNIGESKVSAKGFTDRYGVTFPNVLDTDRKVTLDSYKVKPIPTSFFIDRQGIVRHFYDKGEMSADYIMSQVETLLAKP
ncbi:thiol-disulfide oxidoreductase ResA [Effusibacillus consociatus]|uniref:Thiol-disulfide oxidoreductase ResA n=1 Tax=Effusibacillus consociatus TaxID=1117041 RepID=A0ABV9Q077_9BACL